RGELIKSSSVSGGAGADYYQGGRRAKTSRRDYTTRPDRPGQGAGRKSEPGL
ncbi:hypothetical protein KI387_008342, partial [Taxus chinensis]